MPTLTIDGRSVECAPGATIIEAALQNDIDVPHFCWHPALSVSGNCRMCLVEVEKVGKLAIACSTLAADGQVVHVNNDRATRAREAIMEFLLINHPLDCPICDEAGQCKLQDYAFEHGRGESRFREVKEHKEKRVMLGPNVVFDAERCISCSRCIRFADEIGEQPVLTFVQRGDHVTIQTFPGTELDNPYAMNVIDICPVGALTSRDFRFKARVWDMSFNESVCPGCSRGCNVHVGVRNNEILRLEARTNMKVNGYWMCDPGRLEEYPPVNVNRVDRPVITGSLERREATWEEAHAELATRLKEFKPGEIAVLASPHATCEENYALARFARETLNARMVSVASYNDPSFADAKLRTADRSANSRGVRETVGEKNLTSFDQLVHGIRSGHIRALVSLDDRLSVDNEIASVLGQLGFLAVFASNWTPLAERAHLVLPRSTWAEQEGTFVNVEGTVQHIFPTVTTAENLRQMGMRMSRLDQFGAPNDRWTHGERRHCRPAWQTLSAVAKAMGNTKINYLWAEDVFEEIVAANPNFKAMSYEGLDTYRGMTLGRGDRPEAHGWEYRPHDFRPQIMPETAVLGVEESGQRDVVDPKF